MYKRYRDFFIFAEKAINLDYDYKFLKLFSFLMILYEWSEKYVLEYFDFLKKRKFDITRLVSETLIEEKTLFDIFEEFTSKDFQIEMLDKCDLSENYVNIVKNKNGIISLFVFLITKSTKDEYSLKNIPDKKKYNGIRKCSNILHKCLFSNVSPNSS